MRWNWFWWVYILCVHKFLCAFRFFTLRSIMLRHLIEIKKKEWERKTVWGNKCAWWLWNGKIKIWWTFLKLKWNGKWKIPFCYLFFFFGSYWENILVNQWIQALNFLNWMNFKFFMMIFLCAFLCDTFDWGWIVFCHSFSTFLQIFVKFLKVELIDPFYQFLKG